MIMSKTVIRALTPKIAYVIAVVYSTGRLWTGGEETFALAVGIGCTLPAVAVLVKDIRRGIKPWQPTKRVEADVAYPDQSSARIARVSYILGRATVAVIFVVGAIVFYQAGYWTLSLLYLAGGVYHEGSQLLSATRADRSLWTPTKRVRADES